MTPEEDYIAREAVIEAAKKWRNEDLFVVGPVSTAHAVMALVEAIDNLEKLERDSE